jgi:hypothetical protein
MNFQQQASMIDRAHSAESNYEKTLTLVRALKSGEVTLDCVTLTDDGWQVRAAPEGAREEALERLNRLKSQKMEVAEGNGPG